MTMDINNMKPDIKSEIFVPRSDDRTELVGKSVKRPFDVAFLMLPDEKMKQKRLVKLIDYEAHDVEEAPSPKSASPSNETDSDEEIEVGNHENIKLADFSKQSKYISQKQQVFGDPNITKLLKPHEETRTKLGFRSSPDQKSAFTKVHMNKDSRVSPNLSISPDLTYQSSLSPSPPIINRNYQNFSNNLLSPNALFKGQNVTYPNNFMAESFNASAQNNHVLDTHFLNANKASAAELLHAQNFTKMRPMLGQYRPDLPYNYQQQFQSHHQELLKMSHQNAAAAAASASNNPDLHHHHHHHQMRQNPAAAILSSLLPPSLAALSLPAQNVCAKCNITFRMTSDLVYHMRSHHKNESTDYSRRKREDKLKCPVCAESFRERHHLTRHMTAHQDKDNDVIEPGLKKKAYAGFSSK